MFERVVRIGAAMAAALVAVAALPPANLPVYTDHLVNGFDNWSWAANDLTNSGFVHSGTSAIRVEAAPNQALWLHHTDFDATVYQSLSFWIHGGSAGGQLLAVRAVVNATGLAGYNLAPLAKSWVNVVIPLATLQAADRTNLEGVWIQSRGGAADPFYVDDVEWIAAPAPASVAVSVDASQSVRVADGRWFGLNVAAWDSYLGNPQTRADLSELGCMALRFPGGSLADSYHWGANQSDGNSWTWASGWPVFAGVATNLGAATFITVNYGSSTPAEAAAWVDAARQLAPGAFRYWEIGNECYGTWENDLNSRPHDPYTYANRAADYLKQMRAADPTIKIGVVAVPDETADDNGYKDHPVVNPRTHATVYGWTPVMLTTLKTLGATPDFLIYHNYPEYTDQESDALVMQAAGSWAGTAADLRQQLADYFSPAGAGVELLCTENNSNAGDQGRQSTSLVNAVYLAASLAELMKTEFNSLIWWDLRNGRDTKGDFDPTIFGWRTYGDLGVLDGLNGRYPTFYALKLMRKFVSAGDAVLAASTAYPLLRAYASRPADGALNVLVINSDTQATLTGVVDLNSFAPQPGSVTALSYGLPEDTAARTGVGSTDLATNAISVTGSKWTNAFAPLSLTLVTFPPIAPRLTWAPPSSQGSARLELSGQLGARYRVSTTTNLTAAWIAFSTNTLAATPTPLAIVPPEPTSRFWRAEWLP